MVLKVIMDLQNGDEYRQLMGQDSESALKDAKAIIELTIKDSKCGEFENYSEDGCGNEVPLNGFKS